MCVVNPSNHTWIHTAGHGLETSPGRSGWGVCSDFHSPERPVQKKEPRKKRMSRRGRSFEKDWTVHVAHECHISALDVLELTMYIACHCNLLVYSAAEAAAAGRWSSSMTPIPCTFGITVSPGSLRQVLEQQQLYSRRLRGIDRAADSALSLCH